MKLPFFTRKPKLSPDSLALENWKTSFGLFDEKRFAIEKAETYFSKLEKGKFSLQITRQNHFAWVLNNPYRYNDFCIEADTEFGEGSPYSALGFVFRYVNEQNFCYFVISNKGFFRFDIVFNNNPLTRIDWTACPLISPEENNLRIIAHGTHFSFYIDDDWIAEIEDDTLTAGYIGFAGQNYGDSDTCTLILKNFEIESRQIEVEKSFERWVNIIPQEPEYRITLAKTLFGMSEFSQAAVQMRKALRTKQPAVDDYFFFAEISLNLGMYDLALANIERCLELDPKHVDAVREKGNILYLQNDFLHGREYLESVIGKFEDSATTWNLLGNFEYALGNWEKAYEAYKKAESIQPDVPFFKLHSAHALENMGKKSEAVALYIAASKLFFRQEAFSELYAIFSRVKKLDPENKDVVGLEGEILYFDNKIEEAEKIFLSLEQSGNADSSVSYLEGLILLGKNDRVKALTYFKKACSLEPSFYLYWLKAAESEYLSNTDCLPELEHALALAPEDPWVLNQYGLVSLSNNKIEEAKKYFTDAQKKAPGEADILINLSDAYARSGERVHAFSVLEREDIADNPKVLNHKGNLYAQLGDYVHAQAEYEKALRIEPNNTVFLENCAKAALELDMIMRAEELLLKLFDISPTPQAYNLIGYLSIIKREWVRAEIAFREGLAIDPNNASMKSNLASLYIDKNDYKKAKQLVGEVLAKDPLNTEAMRIAERLKTSFEVRLSCAACGMEWWAPKNIPPQATLKLVGEPPKDAPAGKCTKCGKVYCVGCAEPYLNDSRFMCPDCNEPLKLNDDWIKYILMEKIEEQKAAGAHRS
jgi:tetratricopeptide (TPR) repeat protein